MQTDSCSRFYFSVAGGTVISNVSESTPHVLHCSFCFGFPFLPFRSRIRRCPLQRSTRGIFTATCVQPALFASIFQICSRSFFRHPVPVFLLLRARPVLALTYFRAIRVKVPPFLPCPFFPFFFCDPLLDSLPRSRVSIVYEYSGLCVSFSRVHLPSSLLRTLLRFSTSPLLVRRRLTVGAVSPAASF